MKTQRYLEHIKKVTLVEGFIRKIKEIFSNFEDPKYLPAIINEGNFTGNSGEDFYLKLVLKHQSVPLKKTWLKENLALCVEEPIDFGEVDYGAYIHNVITLRKYKSISLYQLNPLLVSEEINEYENENSIHVNAYYNEEYSNIKGFPILKTFNENSLLVFRKVFQNYINSPESNIYPKYQLVAEFEYRTHHNHFENLKNGTYEDSNALLKISLTDDSLVIIGSVEIECFEQRNEEKKRQVTVVDLGTGQPREHLPNHYDGDRTEGFVCFKPDVIKLLQQKYVFFDLQMFDKNDIQNRYLIDILDDKVVFWEGEYNKLPSSVKEEIDVFNFIPQTPKGIVSEAMAAMQLEGDWNWDRKLSPDYLLANKLREYMFNRAFDVGLSFIEPQSISELKDFIFKIETLTNIRLERFKTSSKDVENLIAIRNDDFDNSEVIPIKLLYQKYCYAIQMELENELLKS